MEDTMDLKILAFEGADTSISSLQRSSNAYSAINFEMAA
jgi:hypothetical protein